MGGWREGREGGRGGEGGWEWRGGEGRGGEGEGGATERDREGQRENTGKGGKEQERFRETDQM